MQRMGNWKDRRMLARYAHLGDENLRAAEESLTHILDGATSHNFTPAQSQPAADDAEMGKVPSRE